MNQVLFFIFQDEWVSKLTRDIETFLQRRNIIMNSPNVRLVWLKTWRQKSLCSIFSSGLWWWRTHCGFGICAKWTLCLRDTGVLRICVRWITLLKKCDLFLRFGVILSQYFTIVTSVASGGACYVAEVKEILSYVTKNYNKVVINRTNNFHL